MRVGSDAGANGPTDGMRGEPSGIVHSDGVVSRWDASGLGPLLQRDPVLLAARIYADFSRGRDDVCILALRARDAE